MKILDIPQSGKRGLYVSQGGRYGQISRMLVIPGNPRTAFQMDVRHSFGSVNARWRTLTEDQRTAWRAAAKIKNTVPRLGQSGPLTGSQLFAKINCTLAALGASQVDAPPSFPQFLVNPVGARAVEQWLRPGYRQPTGNRRAAEDRPALPVQRPQELFVTLVRRLVMEA